jgi:hypothetical protein
LICNNVLLSLHSNISKRQPSPSPLSKSKKLSPSKSDCKSLQSIPFKKRWKRHFTAASASLRRIEAKIDDEAKRSLTALSRAFCATATFLFLNLQTRPSAEHFRRFLSWPTFLCPNIRNGERQTFDVHCLPSFLPSFGRALPRKSFRTPLSLHRLRLRRRPPPPPPSAELRRTAPSLRWLSPTALYASTVPSALLRQTTLSANGERRKAKGERRLNRRTNAKRLWRTERSSVR